MQPNGTSMVFYKDKSFEMAWSPVHMSQVGHLEPLTQKSNQGYSNCILHSIKYVHVVNFQIVTSKKRKKQTIKNM